MNIYSDLSSILYSISIVGRGEKSRDLQWAFFISPNFSRLTRQIAVGAHFVDFDGPIVEE